MPYRVLIKRKAQRQLDKIRQEDRERIIEAVFGVADNPRPRGSRNYRAVYEVDDEALVITVLGVGHRRDIYRRG